MLLDQFGIVMNQETSYKKLLKLTKNPETNFKLLLTSWRDNHQDEDWKRKQILYIGEKAFIREYEPSFKQMVPDEDDLATPIW